MTTAHDPHDLLERFLFEDANVGVLVLSRAGEVRRANRYWERLTGAPLEPGAHLRDCLIDLGRAVDLEELIRSAGEPVMLNVRGQSALPATLYFRFYERGDEIWAFAEHDQLEAQTMRESLVTANNELNGLTRELHKQGAELKRLNETKNRWLGIAAHDLRNPLGIITGMAGLLQHNAGNELSDKQNELLTRIRSSGSFMVRLIDDLLDVAKIESGRLELKIQRRPLGATVARIVELNRMLAEPKGIEIHFDPPARALEVDFDDQRIEQVLNNLLANAIKFSQPETRVTVRVQRQGDVARVEVEDQGPGIPEAERDQLFKAFSRTSVTSTGGEKSTGLGLAIVRKVVESHRGRVAVESEVGRGSVFSFSLPLPDDPT